MKMHCKTVRLATVIRVTAFYCFLMTLVYLIWDSASVQRDTKSLDDGEQLGDSEFLQPLDQVEPLKPDKLPVEVQKHKRSQLDDYYDYERLNKEKVIKKINDEYDYNDGVDLEDLLDDNHKKNIDSVHLMKKSPEKVIEQDKHYPGNISILEIARMAKLPAKELKNLEAVYNDLKKREQTLQEMEIIPGLIDVNLTEPSSFDDIPAIYNSIPPLENGGIWQPANCTARTWLALVMTHRERHKNLKLIIQHMHPFLQKQCIAYQMFVVEPEEGLQFNRGMLKNIGYSESLKYGKFECVAFQDIDVLPQNIDNLYVCEDMPRQLMTALDTTKYKPMEGGINLFGGAVLFNVDQFLDVNGYSNMYFGWGSEDTDLMYRALSRGLDIRRHNTSIGRYIEAKHVKDPNRPIRNQVLHARCMFRFRQEGLNTLKYEVIQAKRYPAYTWLHIRYNDTEYLEIGDEFVLRTDKELGQNFTKYMHIKNRQSFPPPKE